MAVETSVIIPTYNEDRYIKDCIESFDKQSYTDFELIVVDDGSRDRTISILKGLTPKTKLTLLYQKHLGAGAARNLGARHAKGKVLVFVDADMTFERHFLKNLIKPILSGKVRGTFSKEEYVSNWESVWSRSWNINQGWVKKRRHPKNYPDKQKVFRAILKREFDRVGGFTPGGYTDDYSLYEKLDYMAEAAPNAFFYHRNPDSLPEVFGQAKWSAKRKYKLGFFGTVISLVRTSLPVSLLVGFIKAVTKKEPLFIVFKVVYDLGSFMGILDYIYTKKGAK